MSAGTDDHAGAVPAGVPTTFYEGVVRVPGFDDAPDRCRPLKPVGFCSEGHPILGRSSCGTRGCPDHWRNWCREAVVSIVARLAAYRHVQEGAGKRLSHVVASPPQERRYSERELYETRSEAYDALEAAGVRGGAVVTHPYRTNERGDMLYETATTAGDLDEDTGRWRFLRELSDGWEELGEYVEAAPHYHALAAAEDVDGEAAPEGWVVKRVRSFDRFHIWDTESYRDMVATAYYVLTHAAVTDDRQTTTYFGAIHPASFDPEEELTAASWDRIQREAEAAVHGGDFLEPEGGERAECPHDGCEGGVFPLSSLWERMNDEEFEEWRRRVRRGTGGRRRWEQLKGLQLWLLEGGDSPPPVVRSSRSRLLRWLREQGQLVTPAPQQVGLNEFDGAAV